MRLVSLSPDGFLVNQPLWVNHGSESYIYIYTPSGFLHFLFIMTIDPKYKHHAF